MKATLKHIDSISINEFSNMFNIKNQPSLRQILTNLSTKYLLFVYDVTRVESLESAIDWFYEVEKEIKKPVPLVILGNKIDTIPEDKRDHLPPELKIEAWGSKRTYPILNTSAKTGENVDQAFENLINEILGA